MFRVGLTICCLISFLAALTAQEKIKGVCWVAGDSITNINFEPLINNGVDWISQTPFAWMGAHDSPELRFDGNRRSNGYGWGESDYGLIYTSQIAKSCGIKVILKPHIWLRARGGKWRSDISMNSKADWDTWFQNYEKMILHYAVIAEQGEMEALCIGTELLIPSTKYPDRWREIIKKIRRLYSGQLTYAGNFHKEYDKIEFWDDLDFIGVQAYFPLTKKEYPNKSDLLKGWKQHSKKLKKVAKKFKKPVVFTEVGFKNTADAAIEPWLWPSQVDEDNLKISDDTQAVCYEAMFEALWNEEWFGGVYIWKWFHGGHRFATLKEYFEWREERRNVRRKENYKERPQIYFTPQYRPAEQVMARWFSKTSE